MKITVTKKFSFEAAHKLPDYPGVCKELHGHSFKLEVTFSGPVKQDGMIVDFAEICAIVNKLVLSKFDHKFLNDMIPTPTAENLAQYIYDLLSQNFVSRDLSIEKVKINETDDSWVEVSK